MKNESNNGKDAMEKTLDKVVQVDFTKDGADAKVVNDSSSKQELLKEIERLSGELKAKDAEIDRLKNELGELSGIEEKKEESIAIHQKAVNALDNAIKEAEKIVENAKKVADKIIKNAGDSVGLGKGDFSETDYEPGDSKPLGNAPYSDERPIGSVADEMINELKQIINKTFNDEDAYDSSNVKGTHGFNEAVPDSDEDNSIIKLPGSDDLVISKDLLAEGSAETGELADDYMDEFIDFFKNESKNNGEDDLEKPALENDAEKPEETDAENKSDGTDGGSNRKEKKGWFGIFSDKK